MFIQLDCGCIGLLIEDNTFDFNFYKIIDCADDWHHIGFYNSNNDIKYKRYRQLKDDEITPIILLIQQAIYESIKYQTMQDALDLPNQTRRDLIQNLDNTFAKHQTMKSIDTIDKPDVFPFDKRNDDEKQKEIDYIKRHSK